MINQKAKKSTAISWSRLSLAQKASLAQNLSIMLRAGMPLTEALSTIEDQGQGRVKTIAADLLKQVSAGNSLSSALQSYAKDFSHFFINSIKAGESSGTLEQSLLTLSAKLDREKELRDKIRMAMVYPIIILVLSGVLGILLAFIVLPKITPIFSGLDMDLPMSTRLLMFIAEQISERGGVILFGLVVLLGGGIYILSHPVLLPIRHWLYLKTPVFNSISRNKNLAQCFNSLGTLVRSGLGLDEALAISSKSIDNYYFQKALKNLQTELRAGQTLTASMVNYKRLFPILSINMIRVGERSGQLEEQFFSLAEIYEAKAIQATKIMSTFIEPLLLVGIGLVVGWLAISIIAPIYQVTGNIYK